MEAVIYFIKIQLALVVLYGFYKLLFINGTTLTSRRFFILLSIPAAILHPLAFSWLESNESVTNLLVLDALVVDGVGSTTSNLNQNISWAIGEWLYLLLAVTLLLVTLFRVGKIYFMSTKYKGVKNGPYTIYEVPSTYSPASFFSMIFLPSGISDDYKNLIIRHEEVHARQWHSIDVILFEFVKAIFWINPIVHLLERELKLVHEYIADSIASNENRADYSRALLAYNLGVSAQVLTNNFYQLSTIKNRIIMLQKTTSVHSTIFRLLLILPMFIAFSFMNSAQAQSSEEVMQEVDKMPEYKGGTEGLLEYLGNEIKYPKKSKDKGEEGKVFVQFTVSKSGKVKDVEVIKGVSELLDTEALRVIKEMDNWTPGENEGKPVNVQMVLPIMFKLPPPPPTTK